jgi:hypothetical protein
LLARGNVVMPVVGNGGNGGSLMPVALGLGV